MEGNWLQKSRKTLLRYNEKTFCILIVLFVDYLAIYIFIKIYPIVH